MIWPPARPLHNPDTTTERRLSLIQLIVVVALSALTLWLLGIGVWVIVGMEAGLVLLLVIRLFGPGSLSSDQEYALMLAGGFTAEVVRSLRRDPALRRGYELVGLPTGELLTMPAPALARSASVLRSQGAPGRPPFSPRQRLVTTAVSFAVAAVAVTVVSARWSLCTVPLPPSAVVVLFVVAAGGWILRGAVAMHNLRARTALRRYLNRPGAVEAELSAILAPVWTGRRASLVGCLTELCRLARTGFRSRRPLRTTLAQHFPFVVMGAALAAAVATAVTPC